MWIIQEERTWLFILLQGMIKPGGPKLRLSARRKCCVNRCPNWLRIVEQSNFRANIALEAPFSSCCWASAMIVVVKRQTWVFGVHNCGDIHNHSGTKHLALIDYLLISLLHSFFNFFLVWLPFWIFVWFMTIFSTLYCVIYIYISTRN